MSGAKLTDEFKRNAVGQVEDQGHPVREGSERLGVRCPAGDCAAIAERGKLYDDLCDLGEDISPNRAWRLARLARIRAQIGYKK